MENSPLKGPPFDPCLSLALSFLLFLVPRPPPPRYARSPLYLFVPRSSLCPPLFLSPSASFSFARPTPSRKQRWPASSATLGPGDEEGPSGPIYPRASCDDPVDGFQKYTKVAPAGKACWFPVIVVCAAFLAEFFRAMFSFSFAPEFPISLSALSSCVRDWCLLPCFWGLKLGL